jgi:hypothetical protein
MKYQEVKIYELALFLKSDLYNNSINIPITQQRALSQIKNPRADKNDVALIIAINKDNQIVGFIGALPEKIKDHSTLKLAWNSCWWIDSKKGKKTAIPLFIKFLKSYDYNVMFRDLTPKTEQILMRLNKFEKIKKLNGYRYFLRLNSKDVLIKRSIKWRYFSYLLKGIDFLANSIFSFKNKLFINSNKFSLKAVECNNIDDEANKFILKHQKNELFKRGKIELNWILENPWLIKKSLKKDIQFYHFSDENSNFNNHIFKLYNTKNNIVSVLFFTNNNGLVKLPYIYYEKEYLDKVISFIFKFLLSTKANSVLIFNDTLNRAIHNKSNPFWHSILIKKDFVVSKKLISILPKDFEFQDGEGDFVFT